ncbi:pantetheine-phosphate adenylyltransferase [Spirochaetota bacterium]
MQKQKVIFPGTFDPFTVGHYDILERIKKIFDYVLIAVGNNPRKKTFFTLSERKEHIDKIVQGLRSVETGIFEGLLIDYMHQQGITTIIRGLRVFSDYEYELQIGMANKSLDKEIETLFLLPKPEHIYISSSMVKEIAMHKGEIKDFIPKEIYDDVIKKTQKN